MCQRCFNPNEDHFANYGGRGITVCERWRRYPNFLADMGEAPPKMTLERIDNNGNYEPGNCRWATKAEQARNRRTNVYLTHNGKTMCATDWAIALGVAKQIITNRKKAGWSDERCLTQPVIPKPWRKGSFSKRA
jgi:hypothetical protein